jgi:hypothetical protein
MNRSANEREGLQPGEAGQPGKDLLTPKIAPREIEPFVDEDTAAAFASMRRAELLKQTRQGKIRGYPITGRVRHQYAYLLSEVAADIVARGKEASGTIAAAAPVSRRRKSNG